MAAYYN